MFLNRKPFKYFFIFLPFAALATILYFIARGHNFNLLTPKGPIALQERDLLAIALSLMLAVAIPLFVAAIYIAWKYREGAPESVYRPNWGYDFDTQAKFWVIVLSVIAILGVINWKSTHALDPYKPLQSDVPPITVQVVALQWKWLFIYPAQNIATINFLEIPAGTPVNFQLTADAPMNSFWIPQLGGQMYAMPGMSTQLHLEAYDPGEFDGSAAEISGAGFAGMKFKVVAATQKDFNAWVTAVKKGSTMLDSTAYNQLVAPSTNNAVAYYSATKPGIYGATVMKAMGPNMEAMQ